MLVDYQADPVDLGAICVDLVSDGVVMVETTRVNFRRIESDVVARMPYIAVLGLAVKGTDHDWHHYLINTEVEHLDSSSTGKRVAQAVAKWQAAGSTPPYSVMV